MLRRSVFAPGSLVLVIAAGAAALWGVPAMAQVSKPPEHNVPAPQNESEQHLSDLAKQADDAFNNALAARDHCNPKGVADAVDQLQQLEQESRGAAATARAAGGSSAVRSDFADTVHKRIAGALKTAKMMKAFCPQNPPKPAQTGKPPAKPPEPPPPLPPQPGTTPQAGGTQPPQPPQLPPPLPPMSADQFIAFAEDEAEDTFDDYVDAALHCDAKGMQEALDELKALEQKAQEIRDAAQMAGKYSKISVLDADAVYENIHAMVLDTAKVKLRCPLLPQPKPQVSPPCPPAKPEQPRPDSSTSMLPQLSQPLSGFAMGMLAYHNELRSYAGMPPLRWNPLLATHAMDYATTLSQSGELQHSSRQGRENERENIVVGAHGVTAPVAMAGIWGSELQYFRPGKFPNACMGDWSKCGHITQILWGRTTEVGCGFAAGRYDALVCRYSPPGNQDGKYVLQLPKGWPCERITPADEADRPERGR